MSPQLAVDERLRRLAPIVTGAVGFGLAVLRVRGGGVSEREIAVCAVIAVAAALVAYAVATVRGSVGVMAGAVAGLWLAVTATAAATAAAAAAAAATATASVVAVVACALAALVALLIARADKLEAPPIMPTAPAAVALVVFEPRAWALAGVAAAVLAWRHDGRKRWLAVAPAIAALIGGVITLMTALGDPPTWAPHVSRVAPDVWLDDAVDALGPAAMIVGAIGVALALNDRRARWTAAGIVGALASALPLSASVPSPAMSGCAMAIAMSIAAISARVGRTRQQALVGAALATVLVAQMLI